MLVTMVTTVHIPSLPGKVIQEVLRMYPTVVRMVKESPKGGVVLSGYHIPEGAYLNVS